LAERHDNLTDFNMAYLHSELLNDEEDWQAMQDQIEQLPK